jgi:Ala-tRNA(Pro) deacylase
MGVAATLEKFLKDKHVPFSLLEHAYAEGSFNTAKVARINEQSLVKAVLLRDEDFHYMLCALPTHNKILRHTLNQIFDRHLELVDEEELQKIFADCAPGAIPALGTAYGLDMIWDEDLLNQPELYIEAGDHIHLIRIPTDAFTELLANAMHDKFSAYRKRQTSLPKKYVHQGYEL